MGGEAEAGLVFLEIWLVGELSGLGNLWRWISLLSIQPSISELKVVNGRHSKFVTCCVLGRQSENTHSHYAVSTS